MEFGAKYVERVKSVITVVQVDRLLHKLIDLEWPSKSIDFCTSRSTSAVAESDFCSLSASNAFVFV